MKKNKIRYLWALGLMLLVGCKDPTPDCGCSNAADATIIKDVEVNFRGNVGIARENLSRPAFIFGDSQYIVCDSTKLKGINLIKLDPNTQVSYLISYKSRGGCPSPNFIPIIQSIYVDITDIKRK